MAPLDVTRAGVILAVADVERSKAFYVERLGFALSPPWGGGRCFAVDPDGFLIELEELA